MTDAATQPRWQWPLALVLAVVLGWILVPDADAPRAEDAALGKETQSVFATVGGVPIHCTTAQDGGPCVDGLRARNRAHRVLWLGNSQLHAINQKKPGDTTASAIAHRLLARRNVDLIAFSPPNASIQEHLLLFHYVTSRVRIDRLVLGLCFDDTREEGVRAAIAPVLDDPDFARWIGGFAFGKALLAKRDEGVLGAGDDAGLTGTVQQVVESRIDAWLTAHVPVWAQRPRMRSALFLSLYRLRNAALGITPSTKRRRILPRYRANLEALDALLQLARSRGVAVVAYILPLRDDVPAPYVAREYEAFKKDVAARVVGAGGRLLNLEHLVPGRLWGKKDATRAGGGAEIDFMHFQGPGHELLAHRIVAELDAP